MIILSFQPFSPATASSRVPFTRPAEPGFRSLEYQFYGVKSMKKNRLIKYVHEDEYVAEVDVELINAENE